MANDTAKSTLLLDGQQAIAEMDKLIAKNKELKKSRDFALQSNDPKAFKKFDDAIKENEKSIRSFRKATFDTEAVLKNLNGSTLKELEKTMRIMKDRLRSMTRGTDEWKKASEDFGKVKSEIAKVTSEMNVQAPAGNKLIGIFKQFLPALGVGAIVGAFMNIGRQMFSLQERFQTFTAVLKTGLGSKSAAQVSMRMIQDFAAKTPFSVEQLTNGFVKLVNRGFKPTQEEMRKMGDIASSTGKDFDMLVEAMLDAQTGEFERLKEFGIKAKKEGDQVTFTFKGQQTVVDNTADAINKYILSLGDAVGVAGSMAEISGTLAGKTSNLGDAWNNFLLILSNGGGIFSDVVDWLTTIVDNATWAAKSIRQIKEEVELDSASENVKNGMQEIEVMAQSMHRNGMELEKARQQAFLLYKSERDKQLSDLNNNILITEAQMKSYEGKNLNISEINRLNELNSRKEAFETTKRLVQSELEQIESLKKGQQDFSKSGKAGTEDLKDAFSELNKKIKELDTDINNAVAAGDTPLIKKLTSEKKAAEELLDTYEALKDSFEKGYYDLKNLGDVQDLVGLTSTNVKSDKKGKGLLVKRDTGGPFGPSETDQAREEADAQRREDWRDAEFAIAEDLNNTITNMVLAKQQAQLDHKLSMLNAEKEAELSQKNLTEQQKAEIEKRYNEKARKLKREQWIKERNATAISTIVQTALAVMKAAPNVALQVATLGAGALAVTEIMAQPVPEFSRGRYNVTGVSGRQYNADYAGQAVTGLYTRPALVAETGAELIVDPATTRNLQMNFPGVLEAISAARVPQYADGRYPSGSSTTSVSLQDGGFMSAVGEFKQVVDYLAKYGIRAKVSLNDLEDVQDKRDTIEAATEM